MSTDEAFLKLLNDPDYLWQKTGLSDSRRRDMKSKMENNKSGAISMRKKIELLEKAGFYQKQEIIWGLLGGFERT